MWLSRFLNTVDYLVKLQSAHRYRLWKCVWKVREKEKKTKKNHTIRRYATFKGFEKSTLLCLLLIILAGCFHRNYNITVSTMLRMKFFELLVPPRSNSDYMDETMEAGQYVYWNDRIYYLPSTCIHLQAPLIRAKVHN